jgi:mRNA-degrading endonuclease toxin of MazEF toxin-antitoxin module
VAALDESSVLVAVATAAPPGLDQQTTRRQASPVDSLLALSAAAAVERAKRETPTETVTAATDSTLRPSVANPRELRAMAAAALDKAVRLEMAAEALHKQQAERTPEAAAVLVQLPRTMAPTADRVLCS